jgi:hypothetical protein
MMASLITIIEINGNTAYLRIILVGCSEISSGIIVLSIFLGSKS